MPAAILVPVVVFEDPNAFGKGLGSASLVGVACVVVQAPEVDREVVVELWASADSRRGILGCPFATAQNHALAKGHGD